MLRGDLFGLGPAFHGREEPVLHGAGVEHCLRCREGFAHHDHHRLLGVQPGRGIKGFDGYIPAGQFWWIGGSIH